MFAKTSLFENQKLFSSTGPASGLAGGNLFTQQGSSFLGLNNPTNNDKG
jgi:hypothetical protein